MFVPIKIEDLFKGNRNKNTIGEAWLYFYKKGKRKGKFRKAVIYLGNSHNNKHYTPIRVIKILNHEIIHILLEKIGERKANDCWDYVDKYGSGMIEYKRPSLPKRREQLKP